ncbi:hypothetical protein [Streptomyces sp. UG1]|uniref:hypothetical protein n=1 Tax=Streptomyces sp. UG1 TaxID=3417652 RepID=UPI003CE66FE8
MNALLWVLQGIMAFLTIPWGLMTLLHREQQAYVRYGPPEVAGMAVRLGDGPSPAARVGGFLAVACGAALVVPGLIGAATVLTPTAALSLLVPAVVAPARKLIRGEIGFFASFFGMLYLVTPPLLVAWGRLGPYPL